MITRDSARESAPRINQPSNRQRGLLVDRGQPHRACERATRGRVRRAGLSVIQGGLASRCRASLVTSGSLLSSTGRRGRRPNGVSRRSVRRCASLPINASPRAPRGRRSVPTSSSRGSKHTTKKSGRKTYQTLRITLGVHPWCGREVVVLGAFGDRVRAELPDGRACYLPLAWTDWRPRPEPLASHGRPVRLAPEALLALAAWIRGRVAARKLDSAEREKLDSAERGDQKRDHGVGDQARVRAASAAVVGKVGASSAGRARQRNQPRGIR
jgi:hypothetical protein